MRKILLCLLFSFGLHAEPIEFVVTTSPGGATDNLVRKIAQEIQNNSNLKTVVINKPGASHNIGYSYIHSSNKPTVFVATDVIITNKNTQSYPEGIVNSVEPLFFLGDFSTILFVNSNTNIKSLDDLVKLTKERPIKFGHGGIGTYGYESLTNLCGILDCLPVPYKSGSNAMLDVLNGSIDVYSTVSFGADIYMENSIYRPIMLFSNQKHPKYDVPLLPKQLKSKEIKNWVMLFGKNLSTEEKKTIINIMRNEDQKFYTNFGVWYEHKDPNIVWKNSLKGKE